MTWNTCASGAAVWVVSIVFICQFFRVAKRDALGEGFGVAMLKAAIASRYGSAE